eukprot:maker-scaffold405_size181423-snap-gene-0.33 protein:Tk08177 transcript:maker-scaffold405_size181423-snap-gene-0.33-mRNA-1 annotation:"intraflagellar transport protein 25 homolog"
MEEIALEDAVQKIHSKRFQCTARTGTKPWISTGIYPQSIVLTFSGLKAIDMVVLKSYNVKEMEVASSSNDQATEFRAVSIQTIPLSFGAPQEQVICNGNEIGVINAQHLRLNILGGHDSFCAIYQLSIRGSDADHSVNFKPSHSAQLPIRDDVQTPTSWPLGAGPGEGDDPGTTEARKFEFSFGQPKPKPSSEPFVFNSSQEEAVAKAAENFGFRVPTAKRRLATREEESEDEMENDKIVNFDEMPLPAPTTHNLEGPYEGELEESNDSDSELGGNWKESVYEDEAPPQMPLATNPELFPLQDDESDEAEEEGKSQEEDRVQTFGEVFNMLDQVADSD